MEESTDDIEDENLLNGFLEGYEDDSVDVIDTVVATTNQYLQTASDRRLMAAIGMTAVSIFLGLCCQWQIV